MDGIPGLRILPADVEFTRSTAKDHGAGDFGSVLKDAVAQVDEFHSQASQKVGELLGGGNVDVHSAMIAVEKADLSFQLMMQVRNKVVQAYQEIERMQF
jgi:flagellar hook-basal body complex protein FliE